MWLERGFIVFLKRGACRWAERGRHVNQVANVRCRAGRSGLWQEAAAQALHRQDCASVCRDGLSINT